MENLEQLMREYEQITAQIIHWDNLSWQTSNFFFAIESVFLVGIGGLLYSELEKGGRNEIAVILLLAALNIVLCRFFWFPINRRNREFLDIRFARAREIEAQSDVAVRMYTYEREELMKPKYRGHGTSGREKHIPNVFLIAWIGVVLLAIGSLF